ncbi:hypothetical protein HOP52_01935 [Halomonas campisalis]|uniref:GNAT family N-acetyltransferase n=1 Tax=Billgrantia campisalis TaxID=74661 RepID=A0ABS9P603_9GAMM|nr:hypothetical protein [Halomonas campisalis]MCG6656535.1 hypothetical protein [Halomonas campisalis]MDR5861721.1 hypothetical protein [Halomonas campisalis]
MRVTTPEHGAQRDAWLARLCADIYGREAGLSPLVTFSGTRQVLFAQEAARLWALVDDQGRPGALALLVLDESGQGMSLWLSASPGGDRESLRRLVRELALKAPLRVEAVDQQAEDFYRRCGINRWFAAPGGRRLGVAKGHPAQAVGELAEPMRFDEAAILRRFKHDARFFEDEKQRFVTALAAFPG